MFRILVDSRNFTFESFGNTEAEARAMLKAGLKKHQAQYPGTTDEWIKESLDDAEVDVLTPGCRRDNEPLIGEPEQEEDGSPPPRPKGE